MVRIDECLVALEYTTPDGLCALTRFGTSRRPIDFPSYRDSAQRENERAQTDRYEKAFRCCTELSAKVKAKGASMMKLATLKTRKSRGRSRRLKKAAQETRIASTERLHCGCTAAGM